MLTSIVGINWGDEGKGRMVDLLSRKYDVVVRYQGGNNAGHTVINDKGKFVLNLMPSGILRDETVNVLGPGMVIDTEHMFHEVERLRAGGITITPEHLKISDKAVICMPYHKLLDCLEEDRLADKKFGSTRRGISPAYSDKYMKKALRMGELADRDALKARLTDILEWKNLFVVNGYHHDPIDLDEMMDWIDTYAMPFKDYVCDTTDYLSDAIEDNKSVLFEAQLGALRDIDYGIYPYTSGSSTIAAYAPIGAGIPEARLDTIIGIMKAYSTCVGEGPFTCEMCRDRPPAPRGRVRRGRPPLRREDAGLHEHRADKARRAGLHGQDPRVRRLRHRRRARGPLPHRREAGQGQAHLRVSARLPLRHLRLPHGERSAEGSARLRALSGSRRRLPHQVRLRRPRPRRVHQNVLKITSNTALCCGRAPCFFPASAVAFSGVWSYNGRRTTNVHQIGGILCENDCFPSYFYAPC